MMDLQLIKNPQELRLLVTHTEMRKDQALYVNSRMFLCNFITLLSVLFMPYLFQEPKRNEPIRLSTRSLQSVKNSVNCETQTSPLASPHLNRRPHHHHHHHHKHHGHHSQTHSEREKHEKSMKERERELGSDSRNPIADWERDRGMDRDKERDRRLEKDKRVERDRREKERDKGHDWDHRSEKERRHERDRPEKSERERDRVAGSAPSSSSSHQQWQSRTAQSQVRITNKIPFDISA